MEYCFKEEYVPSEFELKINTLIEEQVNNQVGNIKEELIKKIIYVFIVQLKIGIKNLPNGLQKILGII